MGIAIWLVAGGAALALARLLRIGRLCPLWLEFIVSLLSGAAAGLGASALDFGGWNELDWRAALFAFLCSIAAVGLTRAASALAAR